MFSPSPTSRKPLVSDHGMHHGTCITHVPWSRSDLLIRGGRENVPGIPGACGTRNFEYLERDQCWNSTGRWIPCMWKTSTFLSDCRNIVSADDLSTQGARAINSHGIDQVRPEYSAFSIPELLSCHRSMEYQRHGIWWMLITFSTAVRSSFWEYYERAWWMGILRSKDSRCPSF